MSELNDLVAARIQKWREKNDDKPIIVFDLKQTVVPNVDKSEFNIQFQPSNKVHSLKRYKKQSHFQKVILEITKQNDFSRVIGNKIEVEVFYQAPSGSEYEALCSNTLKKLSLIHI